MSNTFLLFSKLVWVILMGGHYARNGHPLKLTRQVFKKKKQVLVIKKVYRLQQDGQFSKI